MQVLREKKQRRTEKEMQADRNNKDNDEDAATGEKRKSNLRQGRIGMVVLHGAASTEHTRQGIGGTEKKNGVVLAAPTLASAACSRGSASNPEVLNKNDV